MKTFDWSDVSSAIRNESTGIFWACSTLTGLAILCLVVLGSCTVASHFDLETEKLYSVSPVESSACRHVSQTAQREMDTRCDRCGE